MNINCSGLCTRLICLICTVLHRSAFYCIRPINEVWACVDMHWSTHGKNPQYAFVAMIAACVHLVLLYFVTRQRRGPCAIDLSMIYLTKVTVHVEVNIHPPKLSFRLTPCVILRSMPAGLKVNFIMASFCLRQNAVNEIEYRSSLHSPRLPLSCCMLA